MAAWSGNILQLTFAPFVRPPLGRGYRPLGHPRTWHAALVNHFCSSEMFWLKFCKLLYIILQYFCNIFWKCAKFYKPIQNLTKFYKTYTKKYGNLKENMNLTKRYMFLHNFMKFHKLLQNSTFFYPNHILKLIKIHEVIENHRHIIENHLNAYKENTLT